MWAVSNRLREAAQGAIQDASAVYVSAATIWEIEIKRAAGRLQAPDDLIRTVDHSGYERLTITFEHASEAARLPPLHGDPFDRMLIAQARLESMTLATSDEFILRYDVPVFQVSPA